MFSLTMLFGRKNRGGRTFTFMFGGALAPTRLFGLSIRNRSRQRIRNSGLKTTNLAELCRCCLLPMLSYRCSWFMLLTLLGAIS